MHERGQIGFIVERGVERVRGRVVLAHGRQSEQQFNRAQKGTSGVQGAVNGLTPDVRADDVACGAARVHVIGAVLCVVLDDENGGFRPVAAMRDAVHDLADGKIVVGHHGDRRESSRGRAGRVVFWQAHHHEVGQAPGGLRTVEVALVLIEFTEEFGGVVRVTHAGELELRRDVAEQAADAERRFHGGSGAGTGRVLAVTAICEAFLLCQIPEMASARHIGCRVTGLAVATVSDGPELLIEVGCIGRVRP